jgi:hypothetical protein
MEEEPGNSTQEEHHENLSGGRVDVSPGGNIKEQFTTVTPFSKYLAMVLFVTLPIVGIFVGIKVGKDLGTTPNEKGFAEKVLDEFGESSGESLSESEWTTFSNSDGVYQIEYPTSWNIETEISYNFQRLKLVDASSSGNKRVFNIGFIANPRYLDEFGNVAGRTATYGEFDSCMYEGGQGPDCILTIVNVPLTANETESVRTDTSDDNEWNLEITYGVSTEKIFSRRDEVVYSDLKKFYLEQEPLLREILNSIEFINDSDNLYPKDISKEAGVNSNETKIYRHSKYNLTINYPDKLKVEEDTSGRGERLLGVLFYVDDRLEPKIQLHIFPREKLFVGIEGSNLNIDSIYKKMDEAELNYENVVVDGLEGFRSNMFNEGTHEQIILIDENHYYDIRVVREIDSKDLFNSSSYSGIPSSNIWE